MAITLIQETGEGVENANTYALLADARLIAEQYGWSLPADDEQANIALINGFNYLNTLEAGMSGERSYEDQAGAFPREDCYCGKFKIPFDVIKQEVITAQVRAAVTFGSGEEVTPDNDGKDVASEEVVGAVKVSYFENGKTGSSIEITEAIQFLERCYLNKSAFPQAKVIRG